MGTVEMKPVNLGYILEVKLAGLVERLDGESKGEDGGNERKKNFDNYAQVLYLTMEVYGYHLLIQGSLSEERLS